MPVSQVESLRKDLAEVQKDLAVVDEKTRTNLCVIDKIRTEHEEELNKVIVDYRDKINDLKTEISSLKKELESVTMTVQRARGGFIVLVGLGSIVGWLLTQLQAVQGLIKGH